MRMRIRSGSVVPALYAYNNNNNVRAKSVLGWQQCTLPPGERTLNEKICKNKAT